MWVIKLWFFHNTFHSIFFFSLEHKKKKKLKTTEKLVKFFIIMFQLLKRYFLLSDTIIQSHLQTLQRILNLFEMRENFEEFVRSSIVSDEFKNVHLKVHKTQVITCHDHKSLSKCSKLFATTKIEVHSSDTT